MASFQRFRNRLVARFASAFPAVGARLAARYNPVVSDKIPWMPVSRPLAESRVAVVTTAGVHHRDQEPFDMRDPDGDASFRVIDASRPADSLMITHDYYDHRDADRDLNVVFPLDRLREFAAEGRIGGLGGRHYSFMGHITGRHLERLIRETSLEAAALLRRDAPDAVLLTPG